jgi:hypothetical protein
MKRMRLALQGSGVPRSRGSRATGLRRPPLRRPALRRLALPRLARYRAPAIAFTGATTTLS